MRSYYDILQVQPNASPDEIKETYRALAWKTQSEGGQDALKEINAAFAVLSNPDRRAEYDRSLAAGDAAAAWAPTAPPVPAPAPLPTPVRFDTAAPKADGPGFHPFLRLFGFLTAISCAASRGRKMFIPGNIILGLVALFGTVACAVNYVNAPAGMTPHNTTVREVVRGNVKGNDYITVSGTLDSKKVYVETKDKVVTRYYWLVWGNDILIVTGQNLPKSGTYTGKLYPLEAGLRDLAEGNAKGLPKGVTLSTTRYLDVDYTPTQPTTYLIGFVLLLAGALLMLVPTLLRYSVFSVRRGDPLDPGAPGPQWPVRVWATGRFTLPGIGTRTNAIGVWALLMRTGDPEKPLEVGFDRMGRYGQEYHSLTIPAGSAVAWGYEYGDGRPRPAVSFRKDGQVTRVCVPTEADARWIAAQFANGGLNV